MRRSTHFTPGRSLRLAAILGVVSATSVALPMALATPASAAGLLPSTTTVSSSTTSGTVGDNVTLTATVKVLGLPGLGLTPTGSVAFSVDNGSGSQSLGSAPIGSCLLKTCTASLSTTALPVGTDVVTAHYGGDLLAAASSGTVTVTMSGVVSTSVTCDPGDTCSTGTITSPDGTTSLDVNADTSGQQDTVTGSLTDGVQLHCPEMTDTLTGALADFTNTASDAGKTIDYIGHGATGAQMFANYAAHTLYAGCFASKDPFRGFIGGNYVEAQIVHESFGDYYEAQLINCADIIISDSDSDSDSDFASPHEAFASPPCFTNIQSGGDDIYEVQAAPGDPKMSG